MRHSTQTIGNRRDIGADIFYTGFWFDGPNAVRCFYVTSQLDPQKNFSRSYFFISFNQEITIDSPTVPTQGPCIAGNIADHGLLTHFNTLAYLVTYRIIATNLHNVRQVAAAVVNLSYFLLSSPAHIMTGTTCKYLRK